MKNVTSEEMRNHRDSVREFRAAERVAVDSDSTWLGRALWMLAGAVLGTLLASVARVAAN